MAISVTLKQSKFGRPYKGYPHHYIGLAVLATGGSGQYEMRFKPFTDWDVWFDVPTTGSITNNKDGFITALNFWHGTYDIQVRDKNNTSDVVTFSAYELFYNNQETGVPMGDTPCIVDNLYAGLSSNIVIKTVKPNSLVRVYRSRADGSNNQVFFPTDEPFRVGISNANGDLTLSLPITSSGVKVCITAQTADEFESLSSNYAITNGVKKKQLKATISYGAATGTGRMITVTAVSGGSGAYSIGILNDNTFPYSLNQAFEIPFGKSNLFIRDNNAEANVEWQISVVVDGGSSSQTFYSHDIRSGFSTSVSTGVMKYGKLSGTTFTAANEYANHDGRLSWGFAGTSFPAIGIVENQSFILAPDRLLFHPNTGGEHACLRYVAQASGTLSVLGNSLRVGRIDNPWATPTPLTNLTTKFKVLHNGTIKHTYTHTTEGATQDFNLSFAVNSGDTIDLVVECGDENDLSFDHVHVKASWSLATVGGSVTAPDAPTLTNASPVLTGSTLNGNGIQVGDYVVMYKDGYPESLGLVSGTNFTHGAMYDGIWKAKVARAKVLSAFSNAITSNQTGNTAPPTPVVLQNTVVVNNQITGTTVQAGTILIFRNGVQLPQSVTTTPNGLSFNWAFTPTEIGEYTFKLSNGNGISGASDPVSATKKRKFTIDEGDFCIIPLANLQSGSGDSAVLVDNWTDGLTFEHNGTVTSSSKAFVRPKDNPTNVSGGFLILEHL